MQSVLTGVLLLLLGSPATAPTRAQNVPSAAQSADAFFSGTVTEFAADHVSVNRTVLGKNSETRTFAITAETTIEGKLRVKARVTVRFVDDRAVHIIVRASQRK